MGFMQRVAETDAEIKTAQTLFNGQRMEKQEPTSASSLGGDTKYIEGSR